MVIESPPSFAPSEILFRPFKANIQLQLSAWLVLMLFAKKARSADITLLGRKLPLIFE